jgi:hypothetical protein
LSRWLALPLGLGIAALAIYVLAGGKPQRAVPTPSRAPEAEPLDDIDTRSRARLERVLERADRPQ